MELPAETRREKHFQNREILLENAFHISLLFSFQARIPNYRLIFRFRLRTELGTRLYSTSCPQQCKAQDSFAALAYEDEALEANDRLIYSSVFLTEANATLNEIQHSEGNDAQMCCNATALQNCKRSSGVWVKSLPRPHFPEKVPGKFRESGRKSMKIQRK